MNVLQRFSLEGKVAVVTGASSGLGACFALNLADAGSAVALGGRRLDRLESVRDEIVKAQGSAIAHQIDVTDADACRMFAEAAALEYGRIDILVNSAGVGAAVPASRESPEHFRNVVDVNLMGSYWMAQACAKYMPRGSSIINVSSVIGLTSAGLPQAAYAASKSGLLGLTRDLAGQWSGRKGIRVNAIAPGFFPTEMTDELSADYLNSIVETRVPMRRLGELEECAVSVIFLASDASSFITGVCLPVDGGLLTN